MTFGITNYLATDHLPRMLPSFNRAHPGIELRVLEETTDQMEKSLLSGRLDFAIMHTGLDDTVTGHPALRHEVLSRDPFLIAAPKDTPYLDRAVRREGAPYPELDPTLLADEPFLMVTQGQRIRQVTNRVLAAAGISPRIVLTSRNYEMLRRLAAEGMGYTLVPRQYVGILGGESYAPQYFMLPERLNAYWELSIVTLRDASLSHAAREFLRCFRESTHPGEA